MNCVVLLWCLHCMSVWCMPLFFKIFSCKFWEKIEDGKRDCINIICWTFSCTARKGMGHKWLKSWYIVQITGLGCAPQFVLIFSLLVEIIFIFYFWFNSIMHHIYWFKPWFTRREPKPDAVVVVHTPAGVFSARSLLPNQQGCFRGSRLASLKNTELPESPTSEINEFEPLSSARCRAFKRSKNKVTLCSNLISVSVIFSSVEYLFLNKIFPHCKALISLFC